MTQQASFVNLYGLGGLGSNLVSSTEHSHIEQGMAVPSRFYVDTSQSNKNAAITDDRFYHITDGDELLDGSGGVRNTNVEPILQHADNIVHKFKPAKFNILVHGGSGGSGSVIGPAVATKLSEGDQNLAVVVVGSRESSQRALNTERTLQTYENLAKSTGRPIVMIYVDSPLGASRSSVDKMVIRAITQLLVLFSRTFRELDTADVTNFLDYTKVPALGHLEPMLVSMVVLDGAGIAEYKDEAIGVASLYSSEELPVHKVQVGYDTKGFGPIIGGSTEQHYVISTTHLASIYKDLKANQQKYEETINSRVARSSIVGSNAKVKGGIVL